MFWKATAMWVGLAVIGLLNATVRQATYALFVSELRAHQISTITCVVAIFIGVFYMLRRSVMRLGDRALLLIGLGWAAATILFEFSFGRLVVGDSWASLLRNYNVLAGRIWVLVPTAILFAPLLVKRVVARSSAGGVQLVARTMSKSH